MIRGLALFLTVLTGFSGLVYEVAWQKYLATLLGSHSEATSAVLGIFLGGLSVGYWLFGAVTNRVVSRAEAARKPPRLLLLYGSLEGGIGLYVLAFPWLFRGILALSYAIPHGPAGIGFAVDVVLATLLIGPASVLMGGTIPILTQALARSLQDATRFHAFVYAFNTAGAFAGALAAGFYLVPSLGLERVMVAMGTINLAAGSIFVLVGLRGRAVVSLQQDGEESAQSVPSHAGGEASAAWLTSYAAVATLTGFAMMAMQTSVNRLGALAFGSSQYTFSMVVAVFVLSIALGSFAVSSLSRIPKWVVVLNQWGIALLFVLLYAVLDESGYYVHIIRLLFRDTDSGFVGYHIFAFVLLLLSIGPPVVLSGATLPLLFHQMRSEVSHLGDLAGTLYSWNTIGSLAGALLGGYLLLFWLDLHEIYRIAIGTLIVAAVMLTARVYGMSRGVAGVAVLALLSGVAVMPAWNPEHLYAGVFRHRGPEPDLYVGADEFLKPIGGKYGPKILLHTDDPIASVVVREYSSPTVPRIRNIATDGKSDGDTHSDYPTAGFLAMLPAMMADKAERAFVIGWGTGITGGELGALESMQEVHVAEISRGVLEAAPLFDFAALNSSKNPKMKVIQSDAYRALMRSEGTYDVIVSQPSHVWSAGVEMLYTQEFLTAAKSRLSKGGAYLQWLHLYENDDETIAMVLRTFSSVFEHAVVWRDPLRSMFILGLESPEWGADHYRLEKQYEREEFRAGLARIGIRHFPALLAHELLPLGVLSEASFEGAVQSLYHPRLNTTSARAFYRGSKGTAPFTGFGEAAKAGKRKSLLGAYTQRLGGRLPEEMRADVVVEACNALPRRCKALLALWYHEDPESLYLSRVMALLQPLLMGMTRADLGSIAELFSEEFQPGRRVTLEEARLATEHFVTYYHHAAPFSADALLEIWSRCADLSPSEADCRRVSGRRAAHLDEGAEAAFEACMSRMGVGPACRAGLVEARALVEVGLSADGG